MVDAQSGKSGRNAAFKQAEADIKRANNELIKYNNNLQRANNGATNIGKSAGGIASSFSTIKGMGFNLVNFTSALYLIKNIGAALGKLTETPDTMNAIAFRLGLYSKKGENGDDLFDRTVQAALRSRSDLESTGNLASRILISGATGGNGAAAVDLSSTINKASFLGGSKASETKMALMQLSQSLASGTMQGDELRTIREESPGLMSAIAGGLSKLADQGLLPEKFKNVTFGQLKDLGAKGELTSQRIIAAFQVMSDQINADFEKSPKQFGQAVTQLETIWAYFLKLLSKGGGAMDVVNKTIWKFVDYLTSSNGIKVLEGMASGLNAIAIIIAGTFDLAGQAVDYLATHADVASSLLAGLIAQMLLLAAVSTVTWTVNNWGMLLFISLVALGVYALQQMGMSSTDVLVTSMGLMAALGAVVLDAVLVIASGIGAAVTLVWDVIVWSISAVVLFLQAVGQLILGLIGIIYTSGAVGVAVFQTIGIAIKTGFIDALDFAITRMASFGNMVLFVLSFIAKGIDSIFGTNLATVVDGWIGSLGNQLAQTKEALKAAKGDPGGDIDSVWNNTFDNISKKWNSDFNIVGKMGDVVNGATKLTVNPFDNDFQSFLSKYYMDPNKAYGSGADFAKKFTTGTDIGQKLQEILGKYGIVPKNVTVDGGDLDSVGKVKGSVKINDQDIKLLRDASARDFLLQLKQITPVANISFGDVRETADVNEIIGVLEEMVDEHLASTLVGG
jgi:tape measure domain-containing protein